MAQITQILSFVMISSLLAPSAIASVDTSIRSPASDAAIAMKYRLNEWRRQGQQKAPSTKEKPVVEATPTLQKDLTFRSHATYENDTAGVTNRVVDKDFESLVN